MTEANALNSQAKRLDVSWQIIEHEYRKGDKSIREIGREHNISDTAIRQHANKHGWEREKDQEIEAERHPNDPTKGDDGLTPQQRIFVEQYLIKPIASEAGEAAGLNVRYAQELLHNPAVALAIGKGQAERSERAGLDADYVLDRLVEVVERCLQHEAVLLQNGDRLMIETPDGEIAAAFTFQSAGANRALELLAKHLKLLGTEKVEHEHTHDHHFHIIPANEVRAEIEEWFSVPALLPPPLTPTKH